MPRAIPIEISTFRWLLTSGGLPLLVTGLVLANLALYCWFFPHRKLSLLTAIFSVVPALLGIIIVFLAAMDFQSLASASTAPKPRVIAELVGRTFSYAFCGLLGSAIAMPTSIAALRRSFLTRNVGEGP